MADRVHGRRQLSLRPRWEISAVAALCVAIFVLRDAGVPFSIDLDVVRAIVVLFITLLTLRTVGAKGPVVTAHLVLAALGVLIQLVLLARDLTGLDLVSRAISLYLLSLSALSLPHRAYLCEVRPEHRAPVSLG